MMKKHCKECPWIVRNNHNDTIINHSKKWNKTHNCHMINSKLWDTNEKHQCEGNKQYINNKNK